MNEREFLIHLEQLYNQRAKETSEVASDPGIGSLNRSILNQRANTYRELSQEIQQWLDGKPDPDFLDELKTAVELSEKETNK